MKLVISLFGLLGLSLASAANAAPRPIIELENQMQQRVNTILQRADSLAIVQVQIKPRKVSADLPMFGMTAQVTPMNFDGQMSSQTIESVKIRVITQLDTIPDWIKNEIVRTTEVPGVKVEINYEKAAGELTNDRQELAKIAKDTSEVAISSLNQMKLGVWGIIIAMTLSLLVVAYAVISMAKRMESSLGRVVEDKVVPAMQNANANGGGARVQSQSSGEGGNSASKAMPSMVGGAGLGGAKELAEFPLETLQNLFSDCYWAEADGYANYLWQQVSQSQKQELLASDFMDVSYFSFVRQAAPENLEYHHDPRYLNSANEFKYVNQDDLMAWLSKNPKQFHRITPLRWDLLPLSLEQRIQFAETKVDAKLESVKVVTKSKPRELKARLEIKQLRTDDEQYIWSNPDKVPAHVRASLRSLVWLALAPVEARRQVLSELDARQLAEAWTGPEPVLIALKEALPAKKLEMLEHFLKDTSPGRSNDTFAYLVESGLRLYVDPNSNQAEAA